MTEQRLSTHREKISNPVSWPQQLLDDRNSFKNFERQLFSKAKIIWHDFFADINRNRPISLTDLQNVTNITNSVCVKYLELG